jgi:hypothetical protein
MPAAVETAKLLSIYDLAKRVGHSHVAIFHAIARLRIKPDQITGGGIKFYSENIIPILKDNMRKPKNGGSS